MQISAGDAKRQLREERKTAAPRRLASYALLVASAVFVVAPIWQIIVHAVESPGQPGAHVWRLPAAPSWDNFSRLLAQTDFVRWSVNSLVVSLAVATVGLLLSCTAGYALSRFRFFGRLVVLQSLLITQIFPATMLLLPIFLILVQLRLIDTFFGLIFIYLATILPFGIWQMKTFYDTIPESVEEAAAMDGCTPGETFRKVVLPVSAPGLAVAALFSFAAAWNEYVVAAILLRKEELFTLPVGLHSLYAGQPSLFAAGALLVALPMLALYLALSKFLVARVRDITIRH